MPAVAEDAELRAVLRGMQLRSIFLERPTSTALAAYEALYTAPILFIEILRFIIRPGWTEAVLVVLAFLLTAVVYGATMLRSSLYQIGDMARALLELQPYRIERYRVDSLVEGSVLGALRATLAPSERINIMRVDPAEGTGRICPMVAYNVPPAGTFIFMPYRHGDIGSLIHFWILHEIGHGEAQNMLQLKRPELARCMLLFLIPWLLVTTSYPEISLPVLTVGVAGVSALVWMKRRFDMRVENRRTDAEILADNYALIALGSMSVGALERDQEAEVSRVRTLAAELRRYGVKALPDDRRLNEDGIRRRQESYRRNLERLEDGRWFEIPFIMTAHPFLAPFYVGACLCVALLPNGLLLPFNWVGIVTLFAIAIYENGGLVFRIRDDMRALRMAFDSDHVSPEEFGGPREGFRVGA